MDTNEVINRYMKIINEKTGLSIRVQVQGLLGVVYYDEEIVFSTAGMQSLKVIEAFLAGMVLMLLKNK